jgi:hypothetical protein
MSLPTFGSACFGFVIGWITYRTLRRREGAAALSDIATVIGAVGGAGVTALFKSEDLFSGYCIGLAIGFVAYLIIALVIGGRTDLNKWMGSS